MSDKDGIRIGEAWLRANELIITTPYRYELSGHHNCDEMGCGQWHVIARIHDTNGIWKQVELRQQGAKHG